VDNLILGGILIFYAELAKHNGHPLASVVVGVCSLIVLGSQLWKELRK
jgi:hypothetical protein